MTRHHGDQLTYASYLSLPALFALQTPAERPREEAELHFMVTHQAIELWFRLVLESLAAARSAIVEHDARVATTHLQRAARVMQVVTEQTKVLDQMEVEKFLVLRDHLGSASGAQSPLAWAIEALAGAADKAQLDAVRASAANTLPLECLELLQWPSVRQAHLDYLEHLEQLETADLQLVVDPGGREAASRSEVELRDALFAYDASVSRWRLEHALVVLRMLGTHGVGTGGRLADYLTARITAFNFPHLLGTPTGRTPTTRGPAAEPQAERSSALHAV